MAEEQNNHHHHHHHHHEHGEHHHHHHHAIPQAVPLGANASYAGEVKQSAGPQKVGLGPGPYKVPTSLYKNNRDRLMNRFLSQDKSAFSIPGNGALFFQGGKEQYQYDTDMEMLFRQESFFYWLFGINEPNVFGVLDLQSLESLLFVPRLGAEYELWAGKVPTKEEYKAKYGVDHVFYEDEMVEVLKKRGIEVLHVISGKNSDSGNTFAEPDFPGIDKFKVDKNLLYWHIVECRVRKTPEEIDLLRYVVGISSEAHIEVMKQVRPGMHEYQLEGIFKGDCIYRGACRYTAYTCICCTGQSGSVLHYGHAGAPLEKKIQEHEMLLLDMGADYQGYCADITCSYPANGKFTADQREVYEMVLAAQQAVIAAMKPGILWPDMHRLAERVILEHLVKHNFVLTQGKTLDELHKLYIPTIFFPHGLGHMLGLDVHDVGGYPPGVERSKEPGIARLRTGRILEEGMVLTVEPGVYFIEANIKRALENPAQKPHLNMDKISRFMNFGGVRLEDDVVVTKNGVENLTKCPRTVEEIEKVMARS